MGADERRQPLVGQRQRDDDAVGRDAAPALGEVPQRQVQALVDALVVGDRQRDGERVRAPDAAAEQLDADLRVGRDALDERVVEDGQARRLEYFPADLGLDVRSRRGPTARAG